MREIVYCLVHAYPMMFSNIKVNEDQILPDKLDVQAHKLKERLRGQLRTSLTSKKRVAENENVDEQSVKSKRGKIAKLRQSCDSICLHNLQETIFVCTAIENILSATPIVNFCMPYYAYKRFYGTTTFVWTIATITINITL